MTLLMAVVVAVICAYAGMENIMYILTGFSIGWIFKATATGFEDAINDAIYRLAKEGRIGIEVMTEEDEDGENK
jgi:hypothetical protein